MILAGNVALETMGFKTFGFGGGREDVWEPDQDVYWGAEKDVARRGQALLRRARAREPARRRADGPHLRQSRRPERQPRSRRRGARHPRDLRAHGDERRRDRRADRRRPHLRQDARRRRRRRTSAWIRRADDIEAQGFGWKSSFDTGMGGDAITSGLEVTWTTTPTKWSNDFFKNLFGYEWELTKSPAGAHQWKPKGDAGAGTVPHAHDTSKRIAPSMLTTDLSLRFDPGLREDLAALPRAPGPVRRRVRARLVQAHPPRHGSARALPRPGGAGGRADLAGPDPGGRSPADRRQGRRRAEEQDPRLGPVRLPARVDRVGVGVHVPRLRQARRRQRRAHSSRAAEGLGGQPARAAREGAEDARRHPARVQRARRPAARRSRSRI